MKFQRFDTHIKVPTRSHEFDAGLDIYSPCSFTLQPGETLHLNLMVGFEIPHGYVGEIVERSSQGKDGITSFGRFVDSDYTGPVHVNIHNASTVNYEIKEGNRVCQMVIVPILRENLEEVDRLPDTQRGDGGHGSTGK